MKSFTRSLVFMTLLILILKSVPLKAAEASKKKPLNFVFILVDDLGYMDVGCNNPKTFYETPHINRLAETGMRFTNGYAANPVCSPTRYSIMTGKYPTRVDATNFFSGKRAGKFLPAPLNDKMPLEEVTIAEALKEHGYSTFFAGKWHLGPTEEFWPENQGFDINRAGWHRGGPYGGKKYFSPYGNPRLTDGPEGEHLPDRLASETAKFIDDNRDQPFFAYLAFYSVHTPLMGPSPLVEKYQAKAERLAGSRLTKEGVIVIQAMRFRTQEQNRDDAIARLVELLQKAAERQAYRVKTKPTKAAKRRRLDSKSKRGAVKKLRSGKIGTD